VTAATAVGQAAAGSPKPEPSPGRGTIHPEAAPSASAAARKSVDSYQQSSSSSTSSAPASSTSEQSYPPAVPRPQTPARPHVRTVQKRVHRPAKSDPAPKRPRQPVESIAAAGGEILATSAHGLTKAPSSSESLLLLLVGLALVVLVVGETTFLRLAARGPERQRAAEEPLPIRRVQLKR
jgi:cobalamin biosynthesis Mg chelatase CobN